MRSVKLLSSILVLLLLAGCARPVPPKPAEYEGYIDRTVILPAEENSSAQNAPAAVLSGKTQQESVSQPQSNPLPPADDPASPETASDNSPAAEYTAPEPAVPPAPVIEADDAPLPVVQITPEPTPLASESSALSQAAAAVPEIVTAVASGTLVKKTERVTIDYSNTANGYVMICFTGQTDKRLKAQVKGPATTYTYNLTVGAWEVFPLSDGNGSYQVSVFENVTGTKYAAVTSVSFPVRLKDEFAPYLLPNQYVNYLPGSQTVIKAAELIGQETDTLKKVELVYNYVVNTLTYDTEKAASVKSGYLPVLDQVLAEKHGICFDYAALMAGMLRSQGVPSKLVVGYAGTVYHAWISVWSEETGWVDGAIFFDGTSWQRMDPTFASSAQKSASIMQYIGDGKNYTAKYLY